MRFRFLLIALSMCIAPLLKGQIGNEFWLAPPDIANSHANNGLPVVLQVTAMHNTTVTISKPADPSFTPIVFNLAPQQSRRTVLATNDAQVALIETYAKPPADANYIQQNGLLITSSPGEITAYYEMEANTNSDIISLKGANSLGIDFWVSTQRKFPTREGATKSDRQNGFAVVASKDGTVVSVDPRGNDLEHHGTAPFTVTLNAGETFAAVANSTDGFLAENHIHGIKVTTQDSDHPVAITIWDDSFIIDNANGGSWDTFADQLIPTSVIGLEYIVLKGQTDDDNGPPHLKDGETVFITPTEDGTDIFVDGVKVTATPLDAGDYFSYVVTNIATHIRASKPIYVNHISGYIGVGREGDSRELGGAVLPPIDKCTGSHSVSVKTIRPGTFQFVNTLMVRNDTVTGSPTRNQAIHNFTYSVDGGVPSQIDPSHFVYIMDSAFAVYDRIAAGGAAYYNVPGHNQILRVENPIARFHLGAMAGNESGGCRYGYFSDFAASDAGAGVGGFLSSPIGELCSFKPLQLVAGGGTSYKWSAAFASQAHIVDKLDYDSIADPWFFPDSVGVFDFKVAVTGECQTVDELFIQIYVLLDNSSQFIFSSDEGCSPFSPLLTNQSDTIAGIDQKWTIKPATGSAYQIDQADTSRSFNLTLPENHTDSIQVHRVQLDVKGFANSCPSSSYKDVKVLPQIDAGFTVSDSIGCHPLRVNFDASLLTTGNIDTNSYFWQFGDYTQSFDSIPSKNFSNYSLNDTTYHVELITSSPFGCTDTARKDILVHPRINVKIAVDTTTSCSPIVANLDPKATVGADTLWWNIDYFYGDSVYKSLNKNAITLTHYDTSTAAGPDTLYVRLIGSNRMGCFDTADTRRLIAYPNVDAEFTVTDAVVCDSVPITFTNNSSGYKLNYDWDFGNNTYQQDSIKQSYTKVFFNRTDQDTIYKVRLTATSAFFCEDSKDTNITIHPYIKADFGLSYNNNCSPVHTTINNTSVRSQVNWWDFGNGIKIIDNAASINRDFINSYPDKDTTVMVKLVVRNPEQCYDSIQRPLLLFPEVVADFNYSGDSVGCAPLDVGIQNISTGGNLTFTWEFGDNSSSTTNSATFNHLYNNVTATDTTYTLKLTARNLLGCDSVVTRPVEVFAYVDAEFSLPVSDSCSPFTIRPTNLSSAGAQEFKWYFGNGDSSDVADPIVPTYIEQDETVRNYEVELIAAGTFSGPQEQCADTHKVTVTIFPELEADILMADTVSCSPLKSTITNNSNIVPNTTFSWYIDNLFYSTDATPPSLTRYNTRNYDTTHTIFLYGRSEHGCRDTATIPIEIYATVDAHFSLNTSGICSGDSFLVDQTYTGGGITHRTWDFFGEDTSNVTSTIFHHVFDNEASSSPITKQVNLTVYNSHNCSDTWTDTVVVYPLVTADFDIDNTAVCYPHESVIFNTSSNADGSARWLFGDGSSSGKLEGTTHTFGNLSNEEDQTYNVKLIATSEFRCFDTITKQITIYAKPDADFFFPVTVACPPFNAEMTNNSKGSNLTYIWDFDGEGSSTLPSPNHTFSNNGSSVDERTISLIVNSDKGCADTTDNTLSVYPDVNVDFNYSINSGCSPLEVDLTGDTTNVLQMIWYVDGQAFSTLKDASYRFVNETPGDKVFDIRFYAQSLYDCSADTTKQITVHSSPIAEFIPTPRPATYDTVNDITTVTFNNQTLFQDNWTYAWDFGDGNTSDEANGQFDYTYGEYFWGKKENNSYVPVKMVAWNTNNPTCIDSVKHDIIIEAPFPQVYLGENIVACEPFTVDFSAITKYIDEDDYNWEFGSTGDISKEPSPTYTFTEPGNYTVKLEVQGDGGTNLDYKIVTVNPKPEVGFTFNDSIVFDSSQTKGYDWINFYNQSKFANSYAWYFDVENDFGGIPDSEEQDPSWYYNEVGEYYVGLIAESGEGCMDTLIYPNPIIVMAEGFVKFPTAFLVNPDGPADGYDTQGRNKYVFYPLSSGVDEFHLEVYNRWGVRVFDSKDVGYGWNGYIDGRPGKQDVYIWRARGRYTNGQPFDQSGDVTLIHGRDEIAPN